jgi:predicted ribosomally synthesized peptide with nif11-like leader
MSQSEVERFAVAVRADKVLQDELKKAAVSNEAIVAFAKSKGYDVNLNEIVSFVEARKATLSEEDLGKVAGGKSKGHVAATTNVTGVAEVVAMAVSVTVAVEAQDVATSSTVAAEAECVIIAT